MFLRFRDRRWWQKKRWIGALALWMLVPYPLSIGPAAALATHGYLPGWAYMAGYLPLCVVAFSLGLHEAGNRYCEWWIELLRPES